MGRTGHMPKVTESSVFDQAGRCEEHGKIRYVSRRAAKRVEKKMRPKWGRMNPFPCDAEKRWWHVGHLPAGVRRGTYPKSSLGGLDMISTSCGKVSSLAR